MEMFGEELAREITTDEVDAGFALEGGVVSRALGRGICAVKIVSKQSGAVRYAICDEAMNLLYAPASSLEELEARFGPQNIDRERAG